MFRPKLDHKYFTSETYWTKWNYLSKWNSNSMKSKDVIEDGINKNPSIIESYESDQYATSTATELTLIIDLDKCETREYLGFGGNVQNVRTLNIILLNYTDANYPKNLVYMTGQIKTINMVAYDKNGNKLDKIKYSDFLLTEASLTQTLNGPTLVYQQGEAMLYNIRSLSKCTPIDLSECSEFRRVYRMQSMTRLPFINVNCPIYFGSTRTGADGSLCDKITDSEWARWFTEDLATLPSGTTKTLYLRDNLSVISDATKKIATDKGWTLA